MRIHELGHVVFFVHDIEKMTHFYEKIMGFNRIGEQPGMVAFSSGRTHHELLLIRVGARPRVRDQPEPGLYHIGLKIGNTDEELKQAIRDLEAARVPIRGMSDHTVTHSLYIEDPEGNEIELYVDINEEWKKDPSIVLTPTKSLHL